MVDMLLTQQNLWTGISESVLARMKDADKAEMAQRLIDNIDTVTASFDQAGLDVIIRLLRT